VCMKERQTNTKMLFVKTKQETVWWFLLLGRVWLRLSLAGLLPGWENVKTTLELDIFRTLFILFISVSLPNNQLWTYMT